MKVVCPGVTGKIMFFDGGLTFYSENLDYIKQGNTTLNIMQYYFATNRWSIKKSIIMSKLCAIDNPSEVKRSESSVFTADVKVQDKVLEVQSVVKNESELAQ